MTDRGQNGIICSQFEALLADALDSAGAGRLSRPGAEAPGSDDLAALPAQMRTAFADHRQSCPNCGPLYAEAWEGMRLLRALEEVDPPRNLVHNILAVTSRVHVDDEAAGTAGERSQAGWLERMRNQFVPSFAGVLRSRFAASFCMAFFSLSLTLSLLGVKVTDIARMATHPSELRKTMELEYTQLQAHVIRYYENMRLVYEVQYRVRELQKAAAPVANQDKGTGQPDQQNWNQHAPGVPDLKEVVQPQKQDAYRWNGHVPRQLTIAHRALGLPDLRKLSAHEIAEFMSKTEGAQI